MNHLPSVTEITKDIDRDNVLYYILCHAVGVSFINNKEFKTQLTNLKPYYPAYMNLNKPKSTYNDSNNRMRKVVMLQLLKEPIFDYNTHKSNFDIKSFEFLKSVDAELQVEFQNFDLVQTSLIKLNKEQTAETPGKYLVPIYYINLTLEQAFEKFLPDTIRPISGFTIMSHLVHFNLKPEALPFKKIIGDIIIDKVPGIKTVVHKVSNIDTTFRTFKLDLMAGNADYITQVKENGCIFKFDFSKVYWNSRLSTEHTRVVEYISKLARENIHTIVFDVFAGIGPFSIPLSKQPNLTTIYANDLNPESYYWLAHNQTINSSKKRPLKNLKIFNHDGKDFIKQILEEIPKLLNDSSCKMSKETVIYVLMNLPAIACEYLETFRPEFFSDSLKEFLENSPDLKLYIFCYCFHKTQSESEDLLYQRVLNALNIDKTLANRCINDWKPRFVRNVAPYKDMYCLQFYLNLTCLYEFKMGIIPKKIRKLSS